MKLTFCFQFILAYFCISAVKCQDFVYTITPYALDINSGELAFDLYDVTETPELLDLEFNLNLVVISNCPDTCDTGVKQNYRLSYELVDLPFYSYLSNNSKTISILLQEQDRETLARHESIGFNDDVYIRFENGFIVNQSVYLIPSGWKRVTFFYPYDFNTYISYSNTSCTEENRLLFKMEWITNSTINPSAYDVSLIVYGLVLENGLFNYGNVTFNWTTQGVVIERYLDFGDTRFYENELYYEAYVIPLPVRNYSDVSYNSGYINLLDPESFDIPRVAFGDGVITVNIGFRPGFGFCLPTVRENLYCTDLGNPSECVFRDYSMTTEFAFTGANNDNTNYNNSFNYYYYYDNGFTTVLTVRYKESVRELFGFGIFPLSGDNVNATSLVLNYFRTSNFYIGSEFLRHDTRTHYNGLTLNYTYEHTITTNEVDGSPVTAEPFCTNGRYIDNNLIRVPISQINFGVPSCIGDGYLTISAVGNVSYYIDDPQIVTRSFLISELGDYLIAPLLQYNDNNWVQYSAYEYYYYQNDQSHREIVHLRIGQYCPSDETYTVFNTSITLPFIAPSSGSAVVTGEGNEDAIIIVLVGHGFCFDQKNEYYYSNSGLTNPNDTQNVLELTHNSGITDSPVIINGDCVYEGSFDGDILYTCYNFSENLFSPVYTGKLIISHETLLRDVVFDGFEVKVISTNTPMPEFELPYGLEYGDREVPRGTNVCGDEIALDINIPAGESIQRSVYVSSNGLISFGVCAAGILPTGFPDENLEIPVLAPFWTQHDHREFGDIFYRYVDDGYDLWNVTSKLIS